MGYESKLFVVEVYNSVVEDGLSFAQVIASIDLSKVGIPLEQFFAKDANCYIYMDDGNTRITEDRYGDKLKICTDFPGLIKWMQSQRRKKYYRRLGMAIALLKAIKPEDWHDIQVLHYGH